MFYMDIVVVAVMYKCRSEEKHSKREEEEKRFCYF